MVTPALSPIFNLPQTFFCNNQTDTVFLNGNLGPEYPFVMNDSLIFYDYFIPANLTEETVFTINYTYTDPENGCVSYVEKDFNILVSPNLTIEGLKDTFCINEGIIKLSFEAEGWIYGPGINNALKTFYPNDAGIGKHEFLLQFTAPLSNCVWDSIYRVVIVEETHPYCLKTGISPFFDNEAHKLVINQQYEIDIPLYSKLPETKNPERLIEVYDILGQKTREYSINLQTTQYLFIPITISGLYILQIYNPESSKTQSFKLFLHSTF